MSDPEPAPAVRAPLLSTEHWGLLAARGTAQSEVLIRITMFLTVLSAGLVSLALLAQATRFAEPFGAIALAVLAFVTVVGLLTQVRVLNVGQEDLMYVLAMNRLRRAYLDLDPGMSSYLMASSHDDEAGVMRTYFFLGRRRPLWQLLGSTTVFVVVLNGALLGLLAAGVSAVLGGAVALDVVIGALAGLAFAAVVMLSVGRSYSGFWHGYRPVDPSPAP
jgi:hypothetical protein